MPLAWNWVGAAGDTTGNSPEFEMLSDTNVHVQRHTLLKSEVFFNVTGEETLCQFFPRATGERVEATLCETSYQFPP